MKELFFTQAVAQALSEEMARDENIFILGEDIGAYGGAFGGTRGLLEEFGSKRVVDSPISEGSMVGLGVGTALTGLRPIIEIMYMDFIALGFDQILNKASKFRFLSGGKIPVPLVVRTAAGGGRFYGPDHSQSLEGLFIHVPGLKIAVPSNPHDAKGMLKAAIRCDDPVLFIEYKGLYGLRGPVSEDIDEIVPFGKAAIKKEGSDLTVVTFGRMVGRALEAAAIIEEAEGVSVEVIDLRTLAPLDMDSVASSVEKTGHLVVVEEGCLTGGVGGEITARVVERSFFDLDAPIVRVAARDIPIPFSPYLEDEVLPSVEKIKEGMAKCLGG